jgi:bacterioferritin
MPVITPGTQSVLDGTRFVAKHLEKALADEWMAHYQYWIGSILVNDRYENVVAQFVEHAGQEYDHATEIGAWLLKNAPRDGRVPTSLDELLRGPHHCGYKEPVMNDPKSLVHDSIQGEACAIRFYSELITAIDGKEYYGGNLPDMLEWILKDEKTHMSDLQKLLKTL